MTPSTIAAGDLALAEASEEAKTIARDLGHGLDVTAERGRVLHFVTG